VQSKAGCIKKCDQCVQCDRLVPRTAGPLPRTVLRIWVSGPIKRGANYVGRPGSAIRGEVWGGGEPPPRLS